MGAGAYRDLIASLGRCRQLWGEDFRRLIAAGSDLFRRVVRPFCAAVTGKYLIRARFLASVLTGIDVIRRSLRSGP